MKSLLFIYNLHAGKGLVKEKLVSILNIFTQAGYLVTAYPTQGKGAASELAAAQGSRFDRVVCCGGDGTLSETISGLMALDCPPVLGYLPAGTTNDFSRNLELPKGLEETTKVVAGGQIRPCDVGRFNKKNFIYVAAFGAFTEVSYDTPQSSKNMLGHLAYLLEAMTRLGSIKSYQLSIEHDGGTLEGNFFYGMVSNTVSVGGFKGLPVEEVQLDDGLFEVVLVKQPKGLAELQSIVVSLLQQKPVPGGAVLTFHTSRLRVSCRESLPWTLDGEYGGCPRTAEIENCKQAIRLVWGP